jgi:hypothetical protein
MQDAESRDGRVVKKQVLRSRRHHKRVDNPPGVWVYWRCGRNEDTSRVRDIGVGGIFIETKKILPIEATVELNFLVEDGGIVAKATVAMSCSVSALDYNSKMFAPKTSPNLPP